MEELYAPGPERAQALYEQALRRFQADEHITPATKELVLRYVRDAALGKTVHCRARKKIGVIRLRSYLTHLTTLAYFIQKDLAAATQEDLEQFIEALERGQIRSRRHVLHNAASAIQPPLGDRYGVEVKINVRKFYTWLSGGTKPPPMVAWFDTSFVEKKITALTPAEVERLIDQAPSILDRTVIQVLFDGGFRLTELLSIRLGGVQLLSFDRGRVAQECFSVRVTESKTMRRTIVLPMEATTRWIRLWLEDHPARPSIARDGTVQSEDPHAKLFPVRHGIVEGLVRRAGHRSLRRRVYPHLLRHSSATYWCNRLPYFKFCKRFGWTMTSDMPRRYIDLKGIDDLETAEIYFRERQGTQHDGVEQRGWEAAVASGDPGVRVGASTTSETLGGDRSGLRSDVRVRTAHAASSDRWLSADVDPAGQDRTDVYSLAQSGQRAVPRNTYLGERSLSLASRGILAADSHHSGATIHLRDRRSTRTAEAATQGAR